DVQAISSVNGLAEKFDQVGGRGLLGHRLPPFLGEAFGGSTGLVDVAIAGRSHDNVLRPYEDACLAQPNPARASGRTGAVTEHGKNDSAAEIENLFGLDLKLLVRADPVFKEAADHRPTLEGAEPPR